MSDVVQRVERDRRRVGYAPKFGAWFVLSAEVAGTVGSLPLDGFLVHPSAVAQIGSMVDDVTLKVREVVGRIAPIVGSQPWSRLLVSRLNGPVPVKGFADVLRDRVAPLDVPLQAAFESGVDVGVIVGELTSLVAVLDDVTSRLTALTERWEAEAAAAQSRNDARDRSDREAREREYSQRVEITRAAARAAGLLLAQTRDGFQLLSAKQVVCHGPLDLVESWLLGVKVA